MPSAHRHMTLSQADISPRRRVLLYSRPHIDLLRVAAALCRT